MWLSGQAYELNWQPETAETESTSYFETIQTIEMEMTDTTEAAVGAGGESGATMLTEIEVDERVDPEAYAQIDDATGASDTRTRKVLSIQEMRARLGIVADGPPPRPAPDLSSRPRIIRRRDDTACDAGFGMAVA